MGRPHCRCGWGRLERPGADHAGIAERWRLPLMPANSNAAIGGLGLARTVVDRAALDGRLHHLAGPGADRDHQIGFPTVGSQLKAAPFHQRPLHILAGGAVGHRIVRAARRRRVNHHPHGTGSQNIFGQSNFFLVFSFAVAWETISSAATRTSEERRAVMGASVAGRLTRPLYWASGAHYTEGATTAASLRTPPASNMLGFKGSVGRAAL